MNKVWPIDESIHCQQLTSEYLEDVFILLEKSFFAHENLCNALEVAKDKEALMELRDLTRIAAKDGVSVVAVDKTCNKVVGVAVNKLQTKDGDDFAHLEKTWKNPKSKIIIEVIAEIENMYNLFEHCNIDCVLDFMFLGTSPECRGKGIGKKLAEISIEIGSCLRKGMNVKQPIDGKPLPLEPTPKVISSIFSTFITQRIGRSLGFEIVAEKSFDEYVIEGKKVSSVVKDGTTKLTFEYRWL